MKKHLMRILIKIISPLVGTGIGNYFPFKNLSALYRKIIKKSTYRTVKKTIYGFSMYIYHHDQSICSYVKKHGYWEKTISDLMCRYLKFGNTFLDLGANIGYNSLLASKLVGNNGKILYHVEDDGIELIDDYKKYYETHKDFQSDIFCTREKI